MSRHPGTVCCVMMASLAMRGMVVAVSMVMSGLFPPDHLRYCALFHTAAQRIRRQNNTGRRIHPIGWIVAGDTRNTFLDAAHAHPLYERSTVLTYKLILRHIVISSSACSSVEPRGYPSDGAPRIHDWFCFPPTTLLTGENIPVKDGGRYPKGAAGIRNIDDTADPAFNRGRTEQHVSLFAS